MKPAEAIETFHPCGAGDLLLECPVLDSTRRPSAFPATTSSYDSVARLLDVTASIVLLVLLAPLMAIASLLVLVSSGRPIIYRQHRLTKGGAVFTLYKFRTMRNDAESGGLVWAAKKDPRVTPVGRMMRIFRVDELPQLYNVLKGEMSLIGPRPERPELAARIEETLPAFRRRLAVKAGLTGLAQVTSGYCDSEQACRRKLALDLLYIKRRCLLLDLKILAKTCVVVVTGFGAR